MAAPPFVCMLVSSRLERASLDCAGAMLSQKVAGRRESCARASRVEVTGGRAGAAAMGGVTSVPLQAM